MDNLLRCNSKIGEALHKLDCLNSYHADWEGINISNQIDSLGGGMDETNKFAAEGLLLICGMISDVLILFIYNANHVLFW